MTNHARIRTLPWARTLPLASGFTNSSHAQRSGKMAAPDDCGHDAGRRRGPRSGISARHGDLLPLCRRLSGRARAGATIQASALRERAIQASALSVCLRRAVSVAFGSRDKTRQSRYDHQYSNSQPLALAAHSRTLNDFGSLEYPYSADRTKHKPDDRSSPHSWLPSRPRRP
jgi:hypothetical protein